MPIRVPLQSVVVHRNKQAVVPPLDKPFDFTEDEIVQIEAVNPTALSDVVTVPVSELDKKPEDI